MDVFLQSKLLFKKMLKPSFVISSSFSVKKIRGETLNGKMTCSVQSKMGASFVPVISVTFDDKKAKKILTVERLSGNTVGNY